MSNTLGSHIRNLRKSRNLTLKQVSQASDISVPYLSDIERDVVNPSLKTLQALATGLNISLPQLVDFDNTLDHVLIGENKKLNEKLNSIRLLLG